MNDSTANQSSARTPQAKSLSADILALTACSSIFYPAPTYPKDGKLVQTKILEAGIKKKLQPVPAVSVFSPVPIWDCLADQAADLARSPKAWEKSADLFFYVSEKLCVRAEGSFL